MLAGVIQLLTCSIEPNCGLLTGKGGWLTVTGGGGAENWWCGTDAGAGAAPEVYWLPTPFAVVLTPFDEVAMGLV